jgi:hypothetical protein
MIDEIYNKYKDSELIEKIKNTPKHQRIGAEIIILELFGAIEDYIAFEYEDSFNYRFEEGE